MSKSILIIGKPHSSKTVYLSQFYSRLQKGKSRLGLYESKDDITPISAAREALSSGLEPQPTSPQRGVKFTLPIRYNNEHIDITCPEYGGEQIESIINNRQLDKNWLEAINESDSWILFIRLNSINKSLDLSDITVTNQHVGSEQNDSRTYVMSEQTSFIELLQIFLHTKHNDYHFKSNQIKLTIALTCWDEINTETNPYETLKERLPLLLNFIESNWHSNMINIIGLSALGFSLKEKENQEKYQIDGPEKYGYVIKVDGAKSEDITELIAQAI